MRGNDQNQECNSSSCRRYEHAKALGTTSMSRAQMVSCNLTIFCFADGFKTQVSQIRVIKTFDLAYRLLRLSRLRF